MKPPVAGSCSECSRAKRLLQVGIARLPTPAAQKAATTEPVMSVSDGALGEAFQLQPPSVQLLRAAGSRRSAQHRLRGAGLVQRQHAEDVVVEQPRFADLGAVEQFGDAGDEVARRRVGGRGREPRGLDPTGDAGEDPALGVGPGAARAARLPFAQVEVLGAGVGERGADVGGVESRPRPGRSSPQSLPRLAALFLVGLEPVGAAVGGVLGLGRGHVGARAAGAARPAAARVRPSAASARRGRLREMLLGVFIAVSFFRGGDARAHVASEPAA